MNQRLAFRTSSTLCSPLGSHLVCFSSTCISLPTLGPASRYKAVTFELLVVRSGSRSNNPSSFGLPWTNYCPPTPSLSSCASLPPMNDKRAK